jgi:hypothetical protein
MDMSKTDPDNIVRQLMLDALDLVHTHDGWITDLPKSLRGVSAQAALWKPDAETHSIWEIAIHVNQWMEDLVRDLRHEEAPKPQDWPGIDDRSETAWQATLDRTMENLKDVRGLVAELTREDLLLPPKGRKTPTFSRIMAILVHDAYHAGQIEKMRQVMKSQGIK